MDHSLKTLLLDLDVISIILILAVALPLLFWRITRYLVVFMGLVIALNVFMEIHNESMADQREQAQLKQYLAAARQKDPQAQYALARFYTRENSKVLRDKALPWLIRAAENHHAQAQYELGNVYRENNLSQALRWFRSAAKQGHREARESLARELVRGNRKERDQNLTEAIAWWRVLAEAGSATARQALSVFEKTSKKAPELEDPLTGMEMNWIEGGCYLMGEDDTDEPVRRKCVDGMYMAKFMLTRKQAHDGALDVAGAEPSGQKIDGKGILRPNRDSPLIFTYESAQAYIKKLNAHSIYRYRLPTEAEWEYACRSGGRKQTYSGSENPSDVGWHNDGAFSNAALSVGLKQANGLGLYDMSGLLWEWMADPDSNRTIRGGAWNTKAPALRCSARTTAQRHHNVGLRLALPVYSALPESNK